MNLGSPLTLGCDRGIKLTQICQQKGLEVLLCDILTLPYREYNKNSSFLSYY
jgi:hypothetical protein